MAATPATTLSIGAVRTACWVAAYSEATLASSAAICACNAATSWGVATEPGGRAEACARESWLCASVWELAAACSDCWVDCCCCTRRSWARVKASESRINWESCDDQLGVTGERHDA